MKGIETILIVDDQLDNLRVLAAVLSEQGYKVRKALDGETALKTAQLQAPDLILLDVNMPHLDGYAVCLALKARPDTQTIPVIFLSGMDNVHDKVRAFAVGAADYITKPFQSEEVLARVRQQLTLQWQTRQLQQEIQERKQAQAETQLLLTTMQAVSEATDFEAALYATLCEVRRAIAWDYAEAWIPNADGHGFYLKQVGYDFQEQLQSDIHAMSQADAPSKLNGLLEKVWGSGQPEWITDILHHFPTTTLTGHAVKPIKETEFNTAFGVPIVLDQQTLAVLIFLNQSYTACDPKLVQLVTAIAFQLGSFIQRKQAEAALRQANRELQRLVNVDGLTHIANRRCFDEVLAQEWKRLRRDSTPLALILCDIDFFKRFNDYYGHLAGDDCLKQVAQAIDQTIHRPADLAARYGGEEFAIVLPNTTMDGAIYVANQIQSAIAQLKIPHAQSKVSEHITVSMGVACLIPEPDDTPDRLIAIADQALYEAKARGRNTYYMAGYGAGPEVDSRS